MTSDGVSSTAARRTLPRLGRPWNTVAWVVIASLAIPIVVSIVAPRRPPAGIYLQGVVVGALYGLIAVGLVLVYRANRIINFAQAGIGATPAVAALLLLADRRVGYPVAVVIMVVGSLAMGRGVEAVVIRRFRSSTRLVLTVATLGLAQVLGFLELFTPKWLGAETTAITSFPTPFDGLHREIGGVFFTGNHLIAVVMSVALTAGLAAFLRLSRIGMAIRAAAESSERVSLLGVPVDRLNAVVWMIAALLSGAGVFLRTPILGLPQGSLIGPSVLLFALTAAVVGRMDRIGVTVAAAIFIGVIDQVAFYVTRASAVSNAVLLPIVLVALAARRGMTDRAGEAGASSWQSMRELRRLPDAIAKIPQIRAMRLAVASLVALAALAAPVIVGPTRTNLATLVLIYALLGLSLVLLTGLSGQISLGQFALAGVGAAVAGGLTANHHADFTVALIAGGLAGAVIAVLVGLPALRLDGLLLAVTSLAFAANTDSFFLNRRYIQGVLPDEAARVSRPVLWQRIDVRGDIAFYYLCLVVLCAAVLAVRAIRRTRSGRVLLAVRDNRSAAQALGIHLARTKLAAFAISGFLAALAGALFAHLQGAVDNGVFTTTASIDVFAMAVIGGLGSASGAIAGAVYVIGIRYLLPDYQLLATGAGLLLLLLVSPGGLAEIGFRLRDGIVRAVATRQKPTRHPDLDASPESGRAVTAVGHPTPSVVTAIPPRNDGVPTASPILTVRDLEVAYGSVQILFGVDIEIREGEIVALLGTNGAGKSTLLRAISGTASVKAGRVSFGHDEVTRLSPQERVGRGVVQMPGGKAIFPSLTVDENLSLAGWLRRRDPTLRTATREVRARFPILESRHNERAGNLSGGEQQMLALAMVFLLQPKVLLIDELSLGLSPAIVADLLERVRDLNEQGVTIVIVEQSVNVALAVATRAYFMEKGEVSFTGPTADLLERDDILRAVFLRPNGPDAPAAPAPLSNPSARPGAPPLLDVAGLSRSFGGITAVDDVSFLVGHRETVGLIGHNGAGKTTVFDLITGHLEPDAGAVRLQGEDVARWSPDRRALTGLGRSFQNARLFPSLTVAETLALGFERHLRHRDHLASALGLPAVLRQEKDIAWSVEDLVELMNLGSYRDTAIGDLSTGTRRIVDLALAFAHDPTVLLLDEPSAGIAQREAEALGPLLRRIQSETGCSTLIIEHDMTLMRAVCDRLIALDRGRIIASGAPSDVLQHPDVVASYLGTETATINRSGPSRAGTAV